MISYVPKESLSSGIACRYSTGTLALRPLLVKMIDLLDRLWMHRHIGGRIISTLLQRAYLGPNSALNWLFIQTILALICAAVQPHRTRKIPRSISSRNVTLQGQKSFDNNEIVHRLKVG